ncbi:aminotransferase class V-fold PLP-dependent enzyme, partial [Nonomuraea phyllanthi]
QPAQRQPRHGDPLRQARRTLRSRRHHRCDQPVAQRLMKHDLGLGAAVDYASALGIGAIQDRVCALAERLREDLEQVPGVKVHDLGKRKCGIVTFTVAGRSAAEVHRRLTDMDINTSVSQREYAQFDLPARSLPDLVRASVHYYNTEEELQRLVDAVGEIRDK